MINIRKTYSGGFKHLRSHSRGFTLIELLVVVSIISLLSSVVLASVNNAKKKGVDAAIIQDARQMMNAVELYYLTNKTYPEGEYMTLLSVGGTPDVSDAYNVGTALAPYLKQLPRNRYADTPYSVFVYTNNATFMDGNVATNCGSTVVSGPSVPKYVIYFSTNLPVNFPFVYLSEEDHYYDGTDGYPKWYCITAR
jgi:prepilin-type N-terminal cleavage/methylation domain-containing protein